MINLGDIKEQFQERLKDTWIKIQESSAFISLKERYDNLTHSTQRTVKIGIIFIGISFSFSILWGLFSQSSEKLTEFEEYQDSIKQLLQIRRDMALTASITAPPSPSVLEKRVQTILRSSYISAEQLNDISVKNVSSSAFGPKGTKLARKGPNAIQQKGIWVSLKSLNLKQIKDIGFRLQTMHDSAKLIGLDMAPSLEYDDYYDVTYTIIGFYPPVIKTAGKINPKN